MTEGTYLGKFTRAGHDLVYLAGTKEGDFFWYQHESGQLYFCAHYPGESHFRSISVVRGEQQGKSWGWDGDEEKPNLTPSIHAMDSNQVTVWHGFVVAGNFRSV